MFQPVYFRIEAHVCDLLLYCVLLLLPVVIGKLDVSHRVCRCDVSGGMYMDVSHCVCLCDVSGGMFMDVSHRVCLCDVSGSMFMDVSHRVCLCDVSGGMFMDVSHRIRWYVHGRVTPCVFV